MAGMAQVKKFNHIYPCRQVISSADNIVIIAPSPPCIVLRPLIENSPPLLSCFPPIRACEYHTMQNATSQPDTALKQCVPSLRDTL